MPPGKPGAPEFMAAYNEAVKTERQTKAGVLLSVMAAFQESEDFRSLAPRTRPDYVKQIKKTEAVSSTSRSRR
ncbi:hypothetical protein [Azorhizobium sp. AG788]|uniref:hypothetical protein n=1 Tax=Azorhizobium sp. AG788 TaxID=2183897 RepID=UPI003139A486